MLVNITGGHDLTLREVDEAMNVIHDAADPEANIIFGTVPDESLQNEMKITVIATGFDKPKAEKVQPMRPTVVPGSGNGSQPVRPSISPSPMREEDLDVPTFIRRKAD